MTHPSTADFDVTRSSRTPAEGADAAAVCGTPGGEWCSFGNSGTEHTHGIRRPRIGGAPAAAGFCALVSGTEGFQHGLRISLALAAVVALAAALSAPAWLSDSRSPDLAPAALLPERTAFEGDVPAPALR